MIRGVQLRIPQGCQAANRATERSPANVRHAPSSTRRLVVATLFCEPTACLRSYFDSVMQLAPSRSQVTLVTRFGALGGFVKVVRHLYAVVDCLVQTVSELTT